MTVFDLLPSAQYGARRRVADGWTVLAVRTWIGAGQLARSVPITLAYAGTLITIASVLTALGPHERETAVSEMSTNLHNLTHGHLGVLVGSAFVCDGDGVLFCLPALMCLLALGELTWRGRGLLVTFAVGHIGATLIVAVGLAAGLTAGLLPNSIAHASDVGISYGALGVLGALTASIPARWRPAWIGWWLGAAGMAAWGAGFTAFGHMVALLLGMALSARLPSIEHWTPTRTALLSVACVFGYLMVSGPSATASVGGLVGALALSSLFLGTLLGPRASRRRLPDPAITPAPDGIVR